MKILAIDPGHTCGIATLTVRTNGEIRVPPESVASVSPGHVYDLLDRRSIPGRGWDVVVAEEFRLYPWLATQQAFSELHTVEVIGVIKYLCALADLPLYMQKTNIKKEARHLAEAHGWPMQVRSLGTGKGKYKGPDFAYPGQQHGRDALAHGCYWAWKHPNSPAYGG